MHPMSERDLTCSEPIRSFGDPVQDRVYGDLQTILEHEETHAEVLGATIEELGGEPIDEPEFEFGRIQLIALMDCRLYRCQ